MICPGYEVTIAHFGFVLCVLKMLLRIGGKIIYSLVGTVFCYFVNEFLLRLVGEGLVLGRVSVWLYELKSYSMHLRIIDLLIGGFAPGWETGEPRR